MKEKGRFLIKMWLFVINGYLETVLSMLYPIQLCLSSSRPVFAKSMINTHFGILIIFAKHPTTLYIFFTTPMSSNQFTPYFKADISFQRGYNNYQSSYRRALVIHIIELVMFAVIIPIDAVILKMTEKMPAALGIAAADSLISLLIICYQYYSLFAGNTVENYCILARDTFHATNEPVESLNSLHHCNSNTVLYASADLMVVGVEENVIRVYGNIAKQEIQQCNEFKNPGLPRWEKVYNFLSLLAMIIVIILMAGNHPNGAEIAVLVVFLVLQALIKIKLVVILILIALSPLICIIIICYACCCKPKDGRGMALNLKAKAAGMNEVVKSSGECSICLMDIKLNEPVFELPCSDKHIFHEGCLANWSRVKATCPVCRATLPMAEVNLMSDEAN